MDIQHLKEFAQLARTENYLEAAEQLFISQSSLSKHIQQLEKELDTTLFDRSTRKVRLNESGRLFLEFAQTIIDKEHQARTELMNLKVSEEHTLAIGSIPLMAPYHITDVLVNFRKNNRRIKLSIAEGETTALIQQLEQGSLDLIFTRENQPTSRKGLIRIPFTEDYLVAVLPSHHPLAHQALINIYDLKDDDFLLLQPGSILYNLSVQACQQAGFQPNITYTGKRAENILDLVEKGMGISLLMQRPLSTLTTPGIKLIPVIPEIKSVISVYYREQDVDNKIVQHFCDFLK